MTKRKIEILELVFSDAELIDIDFSSWDKHISFIVKSDHYKSHYTKDGFFVPIINLKFSGITDVHFEFSHHEKNSLEDDPDKHYHWIIDQSTIDKNGKHYRLSFFQSGVMPKVSISFKDVKIEEMDHKYFDRVNPQWEKQNAGLARPCINKLYGMVAGKR